MYFNIPKSNERKKGLKKKASSSSLESLTTAVMAEDRISEIIHNLDDHWGSPPILTPDTLAHILNHQWISNVPVDEQELENVISHNNNKTNMNKRVISDLIKELYKTIQVIDTKSEFEVTKDLKNDPVLQNFISAKEQEEQPEDVLEHLVELLKYHNTTTTLNHGDP